MFIPYPPTAAFTPDKNLTIDRSQALAHLTALGYKQGDTVYLRSFTLATTHARLGIKAEAPRYVISNN
ncbi:hypothetical protein [Nostoc sp. MS1]|uniref:hypothetical protein n=1 Tax=Nostoc sp. MS1 TaxID=2764711 RepID=UPI001CC52461|nr:hypothetical protein [Nostoc sp. MS1]